jgi:hypothetical protein
VVGRIMIAMAAPDDPVPHGGNQRDKHIQGFMAA